MYPLIWQKYLKSLLPPDPLEALLVDFPIPNYSAPLWQRCGLESSLTPPAGKYEAFVLPILKDKAELNMVLSQLASAHPNATLFLWGEKEQGIGSAAKLLSAVYNVVTAGPIKAHARLWQASGSKIPATLPDFKITNAAGWVSYPGVFAPDKPDAATDLLLEYLPKLEPKQTVLDYGAGTGWITKAVLAAQETVAITACDNNPWALKALAENIPAAKAVLVSAPSDIKSQAFDFIFSNPPIHAGFIQSYEVVQHLLLELPRLLAAKGEAWLVCQQTVPIAKLIPAGLQAATITTRQGFRLWVVRRG